MAATAASFAMVQPEAAVEHDELQHGRHADFHEPCRDVNQCLGVTGDVTRMRAEGKSLLDVRRAIDAKYGGTPTPTPYPKV